ncbi:MAG: RT0821/Lpp0805 family surface protein [Rhizobiaceae bacterium]
MRPVSARYQPFRTRSVQINGILPCPEKNTVLSIIFKQSAILALVSSLGACAVTKPISVDTEPEIITSSISEPVKADGIDTTDTDIIKSVVAGADKVESPSNVLAWSNPDTGNHGTIMAIDKFVGSHGQKCKKFQTTVDSFMGISIYNGETCEMRKGFWVLSWFDRD